MVRRREAEAFWEDAVVGLDEAGIDPICEGGGEMLHVLFGVGLGDCGMEGRDNVMTRVAFVNVDDA